MAVGLIIYHHQVLNELKEETDVEFLSKSIEELAQLKDELLSFIVLID